MRTLIIGFALVGACIIAAAVVTATSGPRCWVEGKNEWLINVVEGGVTSIRFYLSQPGDRTLHFRAIDFHTQKQGVIVKHLPDDVELAHLGIIMEDRLVGDCREDSFGPVYYVLRNGNDELKINPNGNIPKEELYRNPRYLEPFTFLFEEE